MKHRSIQEEPSRARAWAPILIAAAALLFCASGCSSGSTKATGASCCIEEPAIASSGATNVLSDRSLYQLDSSWTNDSGAALKLVALAGRPRVVTMFFAQCEYACPVLVHDLKRIQAALPDNLRTNVGFLLVTFDTERDTPAALANYRRIHELPSNWTLLRGNPDDVLELAALLGVKFKKDARGQFAHSNLITVLDANGEVVHQQVGLNNAPDQAVAKLQRLMP